jgi:SAM-dependent methyltransferase
MPEPSAPTPWGRRAPVVAGDARRHAPSAQRNEAPILDVLAEALPATGRAVEIGSGTGQHIAAFARAFPAIDWLPSDPHADSLASTAAWVTETALDNLAAPLALDVTAPDWQTALDGPRDAIVCINVLHITPWAVAEGLMQGAGRLLSPGGILYLYGPYKRDGQHTAPSNTDFDASLRQRDPTWGIRDIADVTRCAEASGLTLDRTVDMPRDNFSLVFRRAAR